MEFFYFIAAFAFGVATGILLVRLTVLRQTKPALTIKPGNLVVLRDRFTYETAGAKVETTFGTTISVSEVDGIILFEPTVDPGTRIVLPLSSVARVVKDAQFVESAKTATVVYGNK